MDSNGVTAGFNYTYDSMMRLGGATDQNNSTVVSNVQYNVASQLTSINYYAASETRSYNSLFQLTNITTGAPGNASINLTYNYPAGSNNGKIGSMTDAISGETVSYQYDSLNRLISAAGSGWTQTQAYDGFGKVPAKRELAFIGHFVRKLRGISVVGHARDELLLTARVSQRFGSP